MTEREKLIELLSTAPQEIDGSIGVGKIADHLLANGVIVPRIKVGQTIYRCDFVLHKVIDLIIFRLDIYEGKVVYWDDSFNILTDEDSGKTVFLSREEAERALKERSNL